MSHRVSTDIAGRSRKGRALLAGGAVLGLGAVATLAVWSDDVWVLSSFTATPFSIEAAVKPEENQNWEHPDWQKYDKSTGALEFKLEPSAMTPAEPVYAPLGLRLSAGESSAVISIVAAPQPPTRPSNNWNFYDKLRLTLHEGVDPTACNLGDTSTGEPIDEFENEPLNTVGENIIILPQNGAPAWLCFEVELSLGAGTEVQNGNTGDMKWTFRAKPATT